MLATDVVRRLLGAILIACATTAHSQMTTLVEYYNSALDHYFVSLDPREIDDLDSGRRPGWSRTGFGFSAYASATDGAHPVCRFYLPPASGDPHFFSASSDECAETRNKHRFPARSPPIPSATNTRCGCASSRKAT